MLEEEAIEQADTELPSPAVIVSKIDGSFLFYVNYY